MAISLKRLCVKADNKYGLKLVAGENGIETAVRWVHMVEDVEVPEFLHGNELVFTTGIANHKDDWLINFVKNLIDKNSAGLIINIGPYIKDVPQQVIYCCNQNNFPLFTVPWETRLIDMTYEFCRIIIGDEKQEQSVTDSFKNLIQSPENKEGYTASLKKYGFRDYSSYTVVSVKFLKDDINVSVSLFKEKRLAILNLAKLNNLPRGVFFHDKALVLVYQNIDDKDVSSFEKALFEYVEHLDNVKVHMGVSNCGVGYECTAQSYFQSKSALHLAFINGKTLLYYKDIGMFKLLYNIKNTEMLKAFCTDVIGKLVKYDSKNETDYCSVLRDYIKKSGSIKELAEQTSIHRNTLNYKIKKAKEILGTELNYNDITNISLAFAILDILKRK